MCINALIVIMQEAFFCNVNFLICWNIFFQTCFALKNTMVWMSLFAPFIFWYLFLWWGFRMNRWLICNVVQSFTTLESKSTFLCSLFRCLGFTTNCGLYKLNSVLLCKIKINKNRNIKRLYILALHKK